MVLPLHGHLAPAAWAAAQAAPGLRVGYVQTGGGALPGSLSRDVAELRERGLLCGHITAAPAYGGEHEALSTVGALDAAGRARLGRGPGRPRPRHHRLRHRVRPRRHGRPRQRPRRPLPPPADARSPRASPPRTPASATATSATTPTPSSTCSWPRSTSPVPGGSAGPIARPASRLSAPPSTPPCPRRPRRLRRLGPPAHARWAQVTWRTTRSSSRSRHSPRGT